MMRNDPRPEEPPDKAQDLPAELISTGCLHQNN
jgi:hypothetical protein